MTSLEEYLRTLNHLNSLRNSEKNDMDIERILKILDETIENIFNLELFHEILE